MGLLSKVKQMASKVIGAARSAWNNGKHKVAKAAGNVKHAIKEVAHVVGQGAKKAAETVKSAALKGIEVAKAAEQHAEELITRPLDRLTSPIALGAIALGGIVALSIIK